MGRCDNGKRIIHWVAWTCLFLAVVHCSGRKSDMTGIVDGKFTPCPDSPNCVSSQSEDPSHHIAPFQYAGSRKAAQNTLRIVVQAMKDAKSITDTENYIHATFTSRIFRFVADV
jgi:uncharacterized protein (DUF1499 family)